METSRIEKALAKQRLPSDASHDRSSLQRRAFVQGAAFLTTGALAATLLRGAQAQAKMSQQQAQYQESPKDGQQCAGCRHFIAAQGSCRLVEGSIAPNGWCTLWASNA